MVKNISNINNYNLYLNGNLRKKHIQNSGEISFQSKCIANKRPWTISNLFQFIRINKYNPFKEYFNQLGKIQTYIYVDGKQFINPEFNIYLKKLENLNPKEKKQFVKAFCEATGFPNLKDVSKNMDDEIKRAIDVCFKDSDAKPLFAGYNSCCSVGKSLALPGSDCDGLFIVSDKKFGANIPYRWNIGNEINQRIINTQGVHYPELFAIEDLMPYIQMADEIFEKIATPQKIKKYNKNLTRSDQDFMKAGEFNLDIASKITNSRDKDMMYLTSMFVEELRSGRILINNLDNEVLNKIKNSALYKYSNVVRQEGFKNNIKPKWANRAKLVSKFNSKTNQEKFEICSAILKSSMGEHSQNPDNIYAEFDMGNILELISKLTSWGKV